MNSPDTPQTSLSSRTRIFQNEYGRRSRLVLQGHTACYHIVSRAAAGQYIFKSQLAKTVFFENATKTVCLCWSGTDYFYHHE